MKNVLKKIAVFEFLVILFVASNSYSKSSTLTIFAEPNLSSALTEIARLYSKQNSNLISIEFGSASEMINRIEDGEPSDLFISAHKVWIDDLKQKGLIDIYNVTHITDDTLVLVTSTENKRVPVELRQKGLKFADALEILNKNRSDLLIDHKSSSLGQHSDYLVDNNKFRSIRLFRKVPEDRSSTTSLIMENPNIYSIMLGSQINNVDKFQVISTLKNRKIFYQSLVIAGDNMKNAREFSNFLTSQQAQEVFRRNGFVGDYKN